MRGQNFPTITFLQKIMTTYCAIPWFSGFDLTFQNRVVSFQQENHRKTDRKCWPPRLGDKENFSLYNQ